MNAIVPFPPVRLGTRSNHLFQVLQQRMLDHGFRGNVTFDHASRAAFSTDNSVYELTPDLVVAPRDENDVALLLEVMAQPEFLGLPVTARGGGTGTNGQSLNRGVIVNFQRFMTRVLHVNVEEGWADVEPGVVLDALNAEIAATGLFFAPNTSTSSRCTIGGMVGTDASGKGSRIYGKTSDNIVGLDVVLEGGRRLSSTSMVPSWAEPLLERVAAACDAGRDALIARTPRINRRFTGYDLERARPDRESLEWWRLFLGAEGTLGLVTRIRVRLVPVPRHKSLVVVAFSSFECALLAGTQALAQQPDCIEIMDEWVGAMAREVGLTRRLPPEVRGTDGAAVSHMFVEFVGPDLANVETRAASFRRHAMALDGVIGTYLAAGDEQARLWDMRSAAVGLLSKRDGKRRPVAFIEDSVVPVENLVPFVQDFDALMRKHGLRYGIYGHIDVGCLHVRPALDLDDAADQAIFEQVSDEVYALCQAHGGIFWGEHGKGIRGAYLPDFVGRQAYAAMQEVKRAFDHCERFNPGKLVVVDQPRFGIMDLPFRRSNAEGDRFEKSFHCNGNAACLGFSRQTPMCPSYQATRDISQSPKGRADALRQWRMATDAVAPDLAAREEDVFKTLRTCLGCNACASRCPVQVAIPEMKSAFLDQYYQTRRRPWRDHAIASLEAVAMLADRLRPLARMGMAIAGSPIASLLGMVDAPSVSPRSLGQLGHVVKIWRAVRSEDSSARRVLVLADPFTTLFDTEAVGAVCDGLARLGYRPVIVRLPAGAKASHILGLRTLYRRRAGRQIDALHHLSQTGAPMVAVDPAFALMTRHEYRRFDATSPSVEMVQEFLASRLAAGDAWPQATSMPTRKLMGHCTEVAHDPGALASWQTILAALNIAIEPVETGCCGMAGMFGHDARNQEMSRDLFAATWRQPVAREREVFATGFSCRCQVERLSNTRARHPMALIADAFENGGARR